MVTAWILTRYHVVIATLDESSLRAERWTDSRQAHIISHRHLKPMPLQSPRDQEV
jgi:hypothetical protein